MLIYDIHCHLLPGLDDGAFGFEEAMTMAEMAAAASGGCIVCTPHVFGDAPSPAENTIRIYRQLRDMVSRQKFPLRLALGQEIFLGQHIRQTADRLEKGSLLTINRTAYPLVELPPDAPGSLAFEKLSVLTARGFRPILAHPERYGFAQEDPSLLAAIRKNGVLLQVNKGSLSGSFGSAAQKTAQYLLSGRLADFVASDAHSPDHRTTPLLGTYENICKSYSGEYADILLHHNPLHVLRNEAVRQY